MARELLGAATTMIRPARLRARSARGFTLIELSVVVVIVGVLAILAVVGYRRMILTSKLTEAKNMVGAIRIAQEEYKAESGAYLNIPTYCPSDGSTQKKWAWENPACSDVWPQLPVHADGPVQFGYAVYAGTVVAQPGNVPTELLDVSAFVGQTKPYYVVHAKADLDPGGLWTEVAGSSFEGMIRSIHDGQ